MAVINEVTEKEDIKVMVVSDSPDLFVFITNNKKEALGNDFIWFVDNDSIHEKIRFVEENPDLKIQYVSSILKAGWKNRTHKLVNRIG